MHIQEYKTWTWKEILEMDINKTALAKKMGITCSYDTALPQEWLHTFVDKYGLDYHQVIFSSFMVYAPGDYFGNVYSACTKIQQALNRVKIEWIADVLADKYAQVIMDDLKRLTGLTLPDAVSTLSQALIKSLESLRLKEM